MIGPLFSFHTEADFGVFLARSGACEHTSPVGCASKALRRPIGLARCVTGLHTSPVSGAFSSRCAPQNHTAPFFTRFSSQSVARRGGEQKKTAGIEAAVLVIGEIPDQVGDDDGRRR